MRIGTLIALNAGVMAVLMAALWKIHFQIKNAGIVDVGWSGGMALLGALDALLGTGYAPRRVVIGGMALIWGLRLAVHLYFDRITGKPEEPRYATLRDEWQDTKGIKFFFLFEFQGLLDVLLALPFVFSCMNPAPSITLLEGFGMALWLSALMGESIADGQLKRFKASPSSKGKTCRVGLWNYSRHPNYFFEWMIWIAFFVFAVGSPYGWITLSAPIVMFYFLTQVSGIPATEVQALKSRGDDYRHYQRTTSKFVPWFKRRNA